VKKRFGEQTFEGRRENLSQANKLSRTYAVLLDALNRHRGKGTQKITVEHVHIHSGGQAVVGVVEAPGEGFSRIEGSSPWIQDNGRSLPACPSPCGSALAVERKRGEGRLVSARRCRTGLPDTRRDGVGRAEG